jgi:hypothetical protein
MFRLSPLGEVGLQTSWLLIHAAYTLLAGTRSHSLQHSLATSRCPSPKPILGSSSSRVLEQARA